MKISKVLIAAMFAAGFVSVPTTLVMADTREQDDLMVVQCLNEYTEEEGYNCIDTTPEEGVAYTTGEGDVDVKPIDSCWQTEDGVDVCARGGMVPTPATGEEIPVDSDCSVTTDDQGVSSEVCMKAVPLSGSTGEDDGVAYLEDGPVDDTLMFQSGEAKTLATPADPTVSNAVAIFAVLAGALWALVIVMNRRKEAK